MTHHIFGLLNTSTGKSFDLWQYDDSDCTTRLVYEIRDSSSGASLFRDEFTFSNDSRDVELAKMLNQVASDFVS